MRTIVSKLAVLVALSVVAWVPAANAETWTFKADLSGANESPPNDSAATGVATATYETDTKLLSWHVEYSGLTGPAIGAHIHGPGAAGTNAGIMLPFSKTDSPIEESATLTEPQEKSLTEGALYVNIHTQAHKGGEIRGQLVKQ